MLSVGFLFSADSDTLPAPCAERLAGTAASWLAKRCDNLGKMEAPKDSKVVDALIQIENRGFDHYLTYRFSDWRVGLGKVSPGSGFAPAVQFEQTRLGGSDIQLYLGGSVSVTGYQVYTLRFGALDEPAPYDFSAHGFLGVPFEFDQRTQAKTGGFIYADIRSAVFPRERFYGLYEDAELGVRTDYKYEEAAFDLVAGYQPARWLAFQVRGGYLPTNVGPGNNDRISAPEEIFNPQAVPGLLSQRDYFHFDSGFYLAFQGDPGRPAAGVGLAYARFQGQEDNRFNFSRASLDGRGYLPLGSRQRTLAARLWASRDYAGNGAEVPFYMMRALGGHETLRGYPPNRFRGSNILYGSAEYRWEANAAVELAAFYDMGKAFAHREDFAFTGARHSIGGGIRFKNLRRTVFRIDLGRSEERSVLNVAFGPSF
jgi:hypothetical protein